jgi:hypothetical protein
MPSTPRRTLAILVSARSAKTSDQPKPRFASVMSRIRPLSLSSAFGAMRRSLPSFEMLNPSSSGRATALFASLTLSRSLLVKNRLTEAMTRSPAQNRGAAAAEAIHHGTVRLLRLLPDSASPHEPRSVDHQHATKIERGHFGPRIPQKGQITLAIQIELIGR